MHSWKVSPDQAIRIQERLAKEIILDTSLPSISKIAGCDAGFTSDKNRVVGAVLIFSFPQLELIEKVVRVASIDFPYIPGLLTFREGAVLLKAFSAVKNLPDVAIFDGQGIAHPRRMGLATHMGILLDIPTIGCAKTLLFGKVKNPPNFKGAFSYIRDKDGKTIGACLRTRKDVRCIFVSAGYKISLQDAIKIILDCSPKFRIPQPLRMAHNFTRIQI